MDTKFPHNSGNVDWKQDAAQFNLCLWERFVYAGPVMLGKLSASNVTGRTLSPIIFMASVSQLMLA